MGLSLNESEGLVILLWMEKAPPIMISPPLDSRGNSGLPSILQDDASSAAAPNVSRSPMKISSVITRGILQTNGQSHPGQSSHFIILAGG